MHMPPLVMTPELHQATWDRPRKISILGSTGSIGTQALDVVDAAAGLTRPNGQIAGHNPFEITALAAGRSNLSLLARQAVKYRVPVVATSGDADDARSLRDQISLVARETGLLDYAPEILAGSEASTQVAAAGDCDVLLNGITGSIGLAPTLAALKSRVQVALANKESLIAGGPLVTEAAEKSGLMDALIPVDSEHSALAQALRGGTRNEVDRLVLTASGGPFRGWTREQLEGVTPQQALAHPTWDMGLMVTTNSATMVNKALEVLEASLLFGVSLDRIDVTVHRQSVVHSLVQFVDGSSLAQASPPDMRLPIALGMAWPHRLTGAARACDWSQAAQWTFEPLDAKAFPAVELMKHAGTLAGTWPAVYNAANEQAVHAFHRGEIPFTRIVEIVAEVLERHHGGHPNCLEDILEAETWARTEADQLIAAYTR